MSVRDAPDNWCEQTWDACQEETLRALGSFEVALSVRGDGAAAGFGFGHRRDFLAPLHPGDARRLEFQVDIEAETWAWRVDGQLMGRSSRDSAIRGIQDILGGAFALKAFRPRDVQFSGFAVRSISSRCPLSVVITCSRFQQRLRLTLRNLCHQTPDTGSFEILVVNPGSPDGTHELLRSAANAYPHIRIQEVPVEPNLARNKGAMINRGVRASRGEWVWLTDADCLFPPGSVPMVLQHISGCLSTLFYCERRHLTEAQTDSLLAGRDDGVADFDRLARTADVRPPDITPWGYTQIVHRSVFTRLAYRESATFARTDNIFVGECRLQNIHARRIPGLFCLHLFHPFAWNGTSSFL